VLVDGLGDRLAAVAVPVLMLKNTVPTSCTPVAHQSIRPGWYTKNRRRAGLRAGGAASTASR